MNSHRALLAALRKANPADRPLATQPTSNAARSTCPVANPPPDKGRTASVTPLDAHRPQARPPMSMPPLPPALLVDEPTKWPPVPPALNRQAPNPEPPLAPLVQAETYAALEATSVARVVPGITAGAVPSEVAMPEVPKPNGAGPAVQKPS